MAKPETERDAIDQLYVYATACRVPSACVYTTAYPGGVIGVVVEGLDGRSGAWLSAGALLAARQNEPEGKIALGIVEQGLPLVDRLASLLVKRH